MKLTDYKLNNIKKMAQITEIKTEMEPIMELSIEKEIELNVESRRLMIQNAMAYNKHLTVDYLQRKSNKALINNCHPGDRVKFSKMINDEQGN